VAAPAREGQKVESSRNRLISEYDSAEGSEHGRRIDAIRIA
jgi:hypothetical protein